MKIFQAYYKDEQKVNLDNEFTPYDNTANPVINLHEYHIYKRIYEEAQKTNEDLWGHFSWQWKRKLDGVPAQQIIDIINACPGADVYTFHPFPWEGACFWNVWEQGQLCHPHILTITKRIFAEMGLDPVLLQAPMGHTTYLCVNYFIGNKKFWDGLLAFLDRFVEAMDRLPDDYKELLGQSAEYESNMALDYRGFICERMISTYLVLNQDSLLIRPFIEVYKYRINDEMKSVLELKDLGIDRKDRDLLRQFVDRRPLEINGHNWGKDWVETCVL